MGKAKPKRKCKQLLTLLEHDKPRGP